MVSTSDCVIKTKIINGKKVSKPLMEKKRRARINKCLDQLKSLLENYYTSNIRKRKLEKADILELTVKHLRNLQKIQSGFSINSEFAEYQAGFRSCLAGVNQYLADNSSGSSSRLTMLTHLSSSLHCTGGQAQNSSTADSDTGTKHVLPETAVCCRMQRRLPSTVGHEASKAPTSVPLARCIRALKPHSSKPTKLSAGTSQVIVSTNKIKLNNSLSPCYRNKCLSNGQYSHAVTIHNVWRPW
ncbi:hairy-related 3 [Coregonus clupeaformis]|uniref:hairy-related 3 n=1 Tax=Coregonus clupeaformis TaxID=59861 RepID=UPI001BE028EB|nr:hairy-related 3 [Coregonus clupeaformis]